MVWTEAEEGEKSRSHGGQGANQDGCDLLPKGHIGHKNPPAFSMGFRKTVIKNRIRAMAGMRKASFPKRARLSREDTRPMRAV